MYSMEKIKKDLIAILKQYAIEKDIIDTISDNSNIINDLGINSARNVDIIIDIEEKYDIVIADEDIKRLTTVKEIISLITEKLNN